MASLYETGWRQGTILVAMLPLDAVVMDAQGDPARRQAMHGSWIIATQDCDLDQTETYEQEPTVELRPVLNDDPPTDWGIRSARLLLTESDYIAAASPRTMASAALLSRLLSSGSGHTQLSDARTLAFVTWLGKRYDRPAVPVPLMPLARRIADEVRRNTNRPLGLRVRDVLMQVDDSADPIRFSLYAVLDDAADEDRVREWLAGIAAAIPVDLGVADQIEAATAEGVSLQLIETSYAADVTQLTWRPGHPDPTGAT
jgi:hypothetical protein